LSSIVMLREGGASSSHHARSYTPTATMGTGSSAFADDDREYRPSGHLFHPDLRVARAVVATRQRLHQLRHGFQIMDRAKFVDMRQHGLDAARPRLEAVEPQ